MRRMRGRKCYKSSCKENCEKSYKSNYKSYKIGHKNGWKQGTVGELIVLGLAVLTGSVFFLADDIGAGPATVWSPQICYDTNWSSGKDNETDKEINGITNLNRVTIAGFERNTNIVSHTGSDIYENSDSLKYTIGYTRIDSNKKTASDPDEILSDLGMSDIDEFVKENKEYFDTNTTFSELVKEILGNKIAWKWADMKEYLTGLIRDTLRDYRRIFINVIACSLLFSVLYLVSKNFQNAFLSEITFFSAYGVIMMLLIRQFTEMGTTVSDTFSKAVVFMQLLIPTYCMAMSFSMKTVSASAFHVLTLGWIMILEFLVLRCILPMIRIYVIFEFLNYLQEEARFEKLTELIYSVIHMALKAMLGAVSGIQLIQAIIFPAVDQMKELGVLRTVSIIPGVGQALQSTGQLFVGSAIVIKNAIGAAGVYVLLIFMAAPFLKLTCMALLFRLLAAVTEPVTDKRIAGGIAGVAKGAWLYLNVIGTGFLLFLLTIAITAITTNQTG